MFLLNNLKPDVDTFVNECQIYYKRNLSKRNSDDAKRAFRYVQQKRSEKIDQSLWLVGSKYVYDKATNLLPNNLDNFPSTNLNNSPTTNLDNSTTTNLDNSTTTNLDNSTTTNLDNSPTINLDNLLIQPSNGHIKKRLLDISSNDEIPAKKQKREISKSVKDLIFISPEILSNNLVNIIDFPESLMNSMRKIINREPKRKCRIVVAGQDKCGKTTFIKHVALELGMKYVYAKNYWFTHMDIDFEENLNELGQEYGNMLVHFDFTLHPQKIQDNFIFKPFIDCPGFNCVIVYECCHSSTIRKNSDGVVEMPASTSADRQKYLEHFLAHSTIEPGLSMEKMARETPGFSLGEIKSLCDNMIQNACVINQSDFSNLVLNGLIKQPVIQRERVSWADIGGHDDVKKQLINVAKSISSSSSAGTTQHKPDGIIMYGPPGCGKTMLAKALSNELDFSFISLSCSDILNKYQGESEKNVRDAFSRARNCQPAILFMDELDALCCRRDEENSGSKNTIVNTLLTELDGIDSHLNSKVLVIGATNLMNQIDPAISRSKRLGNHIKVTVPQSPEQRLEVLRVTTKNPASVKFKYGPDEMPEDQIFQELCLDKYTKNWSHSDLASLITSAYNEQKNTTDPNLTVYQHFQKALAIKQTDKNKHIFSKKFLTNTGIIMASDHPNTGYYLFNEKLMDDINSCCIGRTTNIITIGGPKNCGKSTLIAIIAKKLQRNLITFNDKYFDNFDVHTFVKDVHAFVEENGPCVLRLSWMNLSGTVIDDITDLFINKFDQYFCNVDLFFETTNLEIADFVIAQFTESERWSILEQVCCGKSLDRYLDRTGFMNRSVDWTYRDFNALEYHLFSVTSIDDSILFRQMDKINSTKVAVSRKERQSIN